MKLKTKISNSLMALPVFLFCSLLLFQSTVQAQDEKEVKTEKPAKAKVKPVKNSFQSVWIIDNQTVLVPVKGTLEMDIQHRFGTLQKGYEDLGGVFAPSNIRLGLNYAPINKLFVGIGLTKDHMLWDANAKYSIITQTKNKYPVSVTYYVNMGYDTRREPSITIYKPSTTEDVAYKNTSDRLSFFHQLIIARKITNKFTLQIAPSLSHQNAVGGYLTKNDSTGKEIYKNMKYDHFAIAFSARYKLTNVMSVMVNYDQPLTKHPTNNPNPNLSFGIEMNTSSHAFQVFLGNYNAMSPQLNNLYNHADPFSHEPNKSYSDVSLHFLDHFRIGFNITRLWNY
jgi:Membrane bound beta barrel domain (DUF5777)